jgi:solute carrier family 41
MDKSSELKRMIIGNIVLTQLQAIVVGFLAAIVSLAMGWVPQGHFNIRHALVLCSSSVSTAAIASLALGWFYKISPSALLVKYAFFFSRWNNDSCYCCFS